MRYIPKLQLGKTASFNKIEAAASNYYKDWLLKRLPVLDKNIKTSYKKSGNKPLPWSSKYRDPDVRPYVSSDFNRQINNLKTTQSYDLTNPKERQKFIEKDKLFNQGKAYLEQRFGNTSNNKNNIADNLSYFTVGATFGEFKDSPKFIIYGQGYPKDRSFMDKNLHERTHSAEPNFQEKAIYGSYFNHTLFSWDDKPYLNQTVDRDDYFDSSTEIYARLMELRRLNNLNPTKVYTKEEIQSWRKDPKFKDTQILERYNDDFVSHLINEIAQNNTTKDSRLQYAKKGGILIPKAQIGRTLTYNWASPTNRTVNWLNKRIYNAVDPTMASIGAGEVIGAGLATTLGFNFRDKTKHPVEEAAWKKRLNLPYDKKYLLDNADGSVRLPDSLGHQIVTDTNFVKNRIAEQQDLQKHYIRNGRSRSAALDKFIKLDEQHLDSLRKFYSTGKPVVINEFAAWKDRKVIDPDTGKLLPNVVSPYNVFHNFTLYNDPKLGKAYKDVYDFNEVEKLVPGEAFVIKGAIK